jgi:hypothetical protein
VFASITSDGIMAQQNRHDLWGNLFVAPEVSGWMSKKSSSAATFKRRWMLLTRERQVGAWVGALGWVRVGGG